MSFNTIQNAGSDTKDPSVRHFYHPVFGFASVKAIADTFPVKSMVTFYEQPEWETLTVTNVGISFAALKKVIANDQAAHMMIERASLTLATLALNPSQNPQIMLQ